MSDYRDGCLKRRAVRAGLVEPRPVSGKNGKARPVVVEYRTRPGHPLERLADAENRWRKWKAYRSEPEAVRAMDTMRRKHPNLWEFRLAESTGQSRPADNPPA